MSNWIYDGTIQVKSCFQWEIIVVLSSSKIAISRWKCFFFKNCNHNNRENTGGASLICSICWLIVNVYFLSSLFTRVPASWLVIIYMVWFTSAFSRVMAYPKSNSKLRKSLINDSTITQDKDYSNNKLRYNSVLTTITIMLAILKHKVRLQFLFCSS